MLQNKEYAGFHGEKCPACQNYGCLWPAGKLQQTNDVIYQNISCNICGLTFIDIYELVGYQVDEEDTD